MKQEVKLTQAYGKTLEDVCFSYMNGQAMLLFSDGTFTTLGINLDEDGNEEIVSEEMDLLSFGDGELIRAGLMTEEELNQVILP